MKNSILHLVGFCLISMTATAQSKAILQKGKVEPSFVSTVMNQANDSLPATPAQMDSLFATGDIADGNAFNEYMSVLYGLGAARKWTPTEVVSAIAAMQDSMSKTAPNVFLTGLAANQVTLAFVTWDYGRWNYLCIGPIGLKFHKGFQLYYIRAV